MDLMLLLSFLSCVSVCSFELWIKLKSACATYSLPKPKYLQRWGAGKKRKDLWDMQEAWKGTSMSPHFFLFPIQRREQAPFSWAEEYLEDWGTLSCTVVRVLLAAGFVTCPLLRERGSVSRRCRETTMVPVPGRVWCQTPWGVKVLPISHLSPTFWKVF